MTDPHYYIATGEARDLILNFQEQRRAANVAARTLCRELGASGWFYEGAFDFSEDTPIPDGLRYVSSRNHHKPDLRTAAGRAIAAKIKALPLAPKPSELTIALCGGSLENIFRGHTFGFRVFPEHDCVVITSREGREPPSAPTCTPLAASEYWRMVENSPKHEE